ncbi:MAG: toprim domain-containing protein [Alphaproteobacteria bacterium]|nr:toprim domain-containing protein [Alphaproteobacteria bacterium]MCB9975934.1 toprim domain-containing protein [Rhodospirillales bacterium]
MEPKTKESPAANGAKKYRRSYRSKLADCPQPDFKSAMSEAGLVIKDAIISDGKLHRFRVEGDKAGSENGWYVLYGDSLPAGAFGCWKRGISETWCGKTDRELTQAQREQNRRRMIEAQKARESEEAKRRQAAWDKALLIWQSLPLAPDSHPYLVKKGVKSHGLRLHKGLLVIPMRDSGGNLHSLQFIDGDGNKRFLSGGRKKGCYFALGTPTESLCIAEGFATAATIYESTGLAVAVAFDAGNLLPVAQALRTKFSVAEIVLCADNDANTPGNPGLTKAREAAAAVGGRLAVPPCAGDFNDFLQGQRNE